MNHKKLKKKIQLIAKAQLKYLKHKYPITNEKIKIIIDMKNLIGAGYFKEREENTLFLCFKHFINKNNLKYYIKKSLTHEYCHLYINKKKFKEEGTFQNIIKQQLFETIKLYEPTLSTTNKLPNYIHNLISEYAEGNSNIGVYDEVMCEIFAQYNCYNYKKNYCNLKNYAYELHEKMVIWLINYILIKKDFYYINEIDFL